MKVYEFKGFPNPARVRIALAEAGMLEAAEFVQVDVPGGEHKKAEFLAKNPSGAVPVLELEDGTVISECSAITEYIDQAAGKGELMGKTAKERAVIAMTQKKVESGFLDAVADFFHHATDGLGPDIESYQNVGWGTRRREVALKTLDWMETILSTQPYLAGEKFTIADITAQAGFLFAGFVKLEIPETCPHVKDYMTRLAGRDSIKAAA